jgi:thiosulfate/3-mercaptopyruvate sulfurtransferase
MQKPDMANQSVQWVSPEWVQERMGQGLFWILDVQPDVHDYILGHLPGAVHFPEKLWRCPCGNGYPACYAPTVSIEAELRRVGVNSDTPVLVYSGKGPFSEQGDGLEATMTAYSLIRYGHEKVFILDGGIDRWHQERRPIVKDYPEIPESSFACSVRTDLFCGYDEFRELRKRDDVQVFDVRPRDVYEGQAIWMKPGHIPGAVNLPWRMMFAHDNANLLRPIEKLQKQVQRAEADPDRLTILYCGTGREATAEFIILKWVLGYEQVKLYEGSFTEWCMHPENETVVGHSAGALASR